MEGLTESACAEWLCRNDVSVLDGRADFCDLPRRHFFIPSDAGARVAMCRAQLEAFADADETLLHVGQTGVWPSGEVMPILTMLRRLHGIDTSLRETPGNLLRRDEGDTLLSLATLAVTFLWDCTLIRSDVRAVLFYSHDEFGWLYDARSDAAKVAADSEHRSVLAWRETLRAAAPPLSS